MLDLHTLKIDFVFHPNPCKQCKLFLSLRFGGSTEELTHVFLWEGG